MKKPPILPLPPSAQVSPGLGDRLIRWLQRAPTRPAGDATGAEADDGPADRGRLVWFRCPDAGAATSLAGLLRRIGADLPDVVPFVTVDDGPLPSGPPGQVFRGPAEESAAVARFLDRWQPHVAVLIGGAFLPITVQELSVRSVPVIGAALRWPEGHWMERRTARPLARHHLHRFARLMTEGPDGRDGLLRCGAPPDRTVVGGTLVADVPVPPGSESERQSLAELLTSRPVWCASDLPIGELALVAGAQQIAMRLSHRLLLVVVPVNIADGPAMRDALLAEGMNVALRSVGEEPTEHVSVYIADLGGELGLWLRLSPVAFLGGTLTPGSGSRTPLEAAGLGSAILHGPETAGHAADYERLHAAKAARSVTGAESLAAELDRLLAPDIAAQMAHAAWEVTSAGDEAALRMLDALSAALDPAAAPA